MQTDRRPGRRRQAESDEDLLARLSAEFPTLAAANPWGAALANENLMVGIVQDVVKVVAAEPATRGTRTMPELDVASAIVADLRGEVSTSPFPAAFHDLAGHLSASGVEAKTGVRKHIVIRLRNEVLRPTMAEMAQLATGFRRSPAYFSEYRLGALLAIMANQLSPEQTAALMRRLRQQ